MLTVAPRGNTNPAVRFEMPFFSSAHSMVSGRVAELDAVEKAVSRAGKVRKA